MSTSNPIDPDRVRVVEQGGPCGAGAADYARERIARLALYTARPLLFAKVRLIKHIEPTAVIAKGMLDIDGEVTIAQAHGFSAREAIDRLADALRRDITEEPRNRVASRHHTPEG